VSATGDRPAISVIVPAYNAAAYLADCFAGLTAQTFADFEVVAVDDGSTDDTPAALREWAQRDGRVRVHSQQNGGGYRARLAGVRLARGRYVAFVDADDHVEPTFLAHLYATAERTAADIVVAGFDRVDMDTGCQLSTEMTSWGESVLGVHAAEARLLDINTALWNKLFRASALADLWQLAQPPTLGDDVLVFLCALLNSTRIAFWPGVEYHYVVRPGSVVQTFSTSKIDPLGRSLVTAKRRVCDNPETVAYGELVDALAFVHLGLSASYRLISNGTTRAAPVVRSTLRLLDVQFASWRHTRLLVANHRYRLLRAVARLGLLTPALKSLAFVLKTTRRDLSW